MIKSGIRVLVACAAICGMAIFSPLARGVPYASQVRNTLGTTYEFVLNEGDANVTIKRDGGNALSLGVLPAGRHTFDLDTFSSFDIEVSKSAPKGWTAISDLGNEFTHFERPAGLAINNDPSSPFFGTVYIANTRDTATVSGRSMAPGLYALSANLVGVDLANNFGVVTDPNDTSLFKAPGFTVDQSTTASPWRITLDDGGNVIVADWSDASGGIKYASPDLTTGGLVLAIEGGPDGGVDSSVSDEFGPIPLHGSILSEPIVTGTVGVDLTVWAIDEDVDAEFSIPINDRNSLWRWDVGSATEHDLPPTLVVDSKSLPGWILGSTIPNIRGDAAYSPVHDKWYLTQNRSDGFEQPGLVIVTADPNDPSNPTIDFNSFEFSVANGLDGLPDNPDAPTTIGIQDIFREMGTVEVAPDGSKLYLRRQSVAAAAAFTNTPVNTLNPGAVLIIPLDANGIPIIEIDDNGTPGDSSDDFVSNWESIVIASNAGNSTIGNEVDFDAAGNVYTTSNISERLQVFSPGGNTLAITSSNGTFSVIELLGVPGDYNGDGLVDAADYTVWRDNLGGDGSNLQNRDPALAGVPVGQGDYAFWVSNFGQSDQASLTVAAVPEPASWLLALAAMGLVVGWQRRRRAD